jgi:hypothetical protein
MMGGGGGGGDPFTKKKLHYFLSVFLITGHDEASKVKAAVMHHALARPSKTLSIS